MKLSYKDPTKKDWFLVTWDLSDKCNYRCSYCPSFLHDGINGWPDYDTVIQFIDSLSKQLPDKQLCYRFSGGEPTYWKHFVSLVKYIKTTGAYVSLLSNGSRDTTYWSELDKHCDGVILSYHPEYATPEQFINVASVLNCPVAVNLMLTPDNFTETLAIAKQLYENSSMAIWPKLIHDKMGEITNQLYDYTSEQKDIITNWKYFRPLDSSKIHRGELQLDGTVVNANDLILSGKNKFAGWTCYAGIDQINVGLDGTVYRADCMYGGPLGTIENYVLPTEPVVCGKSSCNCLSDIYIRKEQ